MLAPRIARLMLNRRRRPARTTTTITIRLSSTAPGSTPTPTPTPTANQSHHHDLGSFIAYAERVKLPRSSTVYIGTRYEYVVGASLRRLGLRLTRIGGRSDAGVDLVGEWGLPGFILSSPPTTSSSSSSSCPSSSLKVIVQCKALHPHRRAGPNLVRELEGAFAGAPTGWRADGAVLGLLVVPTQATKGVRLALARSRLPLAFVMLTAEGVVVQFLWNRAAQHLGLQDLGVTTRYRVRKGEEEEEEEYGNEDEEEEEGKGKEGKDVEDDDHDDDNDNNKKGQEEEVVLEQQEVRGEVALTWRGEVLGNLDQ